jgi:hypothetical protein
MYDDIGKLQAAARELSENVLPVLEIVEGSARLKQTGSAFIFRHEGRASLVTADHVVCGPQQKLVQIAPGQTVRWPNSYNVVRSRASEIPSPDLAYVFGELDAERPGGIRPQNIGLEFQTEAGASLLAVGYPGSRADLFQQEQSLKNELHYLLTQAAPLSDYEKVGLDPRFHIALRYDPKGLHDVEGNSKVGAKPHGMSGGLLFAPLRTTPEPPGDYLLVVVGVLVKYFKSPHHLIAATRIECLLDAMAPYRTEALRSFEASESRGECVD